MARRTWAAPVSDIDVDDLAAKIAERLKVPDERPLLSPKDLAARLAVSERTARTMIAEGPNGEPPKIPSFVIADGARRIDPRAVDAYLASRQG